MTLDEKKIEQLVERLAQVAPHIDESRRRPFIENMLETDPDREDFYIRRKGGIGASDSACIILEKLGKRSPFGTTVDLFLEKQCYTLPSEKQADPEKAGHFERGHVLEPYILDKFKKESGFIDFHEGLAVYEAFVANGGLSGTAARATPDGVFIHPETKEVVMVDAKAPMKASGHVEDHYMIQLAQGRKLFEMAGIRIDRLLLLQLDIATMNVLALDVRVPKKIDEMLLPAIDEFWNEYVVPDKRPVFDNGKTFQRLEELPTRVQAKVETFVLANQLKGLSEKRATAAKEELETSLASYGYNLMNADKTALGKLSYSVGAPRRGVDTDKLQEALVAALVANGEDYDAAYERVYEGDEFAKYSQASGSFRVVSSARSEYYEDVMRTKETAQMLIETEINGHLATLGMTEDDLDFEAELEAELNGTKSQSDEGTPSPF